MEYSEIIYIACYFLMIIYFVILGCFMIVQRTRHAHTQLEIIHKQRMTRSTGVFMFIWALECLTYLPSILIYGYDETQQGYDLCFLITVMLNTPALFMIMNVIVQKTADNLKWIGGTALPFMLLTVWYLVDPDGSGRLPIYIASVLVVASIALLFLRYTGEYHNYIRRLRSEYSETSGREITWAWSCFVGFALQSFVYLLYQFYWSLVLEYVYLCISMLNATYLCHCICRQKPLNKDAMDEVINNDTVPETAAPDKTVPLDVPKEKPYLAIIEKKLDTICEKEQLYLEPDLTRERLCLRLSVGRTYLGLYFQSRGTTFYQYINSLRINHAVKLMQEQPQMSIREISEHSGFRSQTTFRKVFREEMGCLPSEVRTTPKENSDGTDN